MVNTADATTQPVATPEITQTVSAPQEPSPQVEVVVENQIEQTEQTEQTEQKKVETIVEMSPAGAAAEKEEKKKPSACQRFCKRWFIDAFGGMAMGLFCTLIAGLILKQIAKLFGNSVVATLLTNIGIIAGILTGCGIGAGIGHALNAPRLVLFCAIVNGFIGANANAINKGTFVTNGAITVSGGGDPISAYLASIVAVEIGLLIAGKTSIDILLVPLVSLISGTVVAYFFGPPVAALLSAIGRGIELATTLQPVLMGIVVSIVMGILLTMPTSSAAIGISIQMNGISAAAACAGCAAQMVGFAVSSFRENRWGGLIAQGLGTSMLQIPNIFKHPLVFIPPIVASAITGPIASAAFKLKCNAAGSGMGTSGLVGVLMTYDMSVEELGMGRTIAGILVCHFIIPIVVSLAVSEFMRKKGWIKQGDMQLSS